VTGRRTTEIVIVGGGPAAVETLIGLHDLAGERVRTTIVAPEPEFVMRPLQVTEPFGDGETIRRPLEQIAADFGARFVQARVASVDAPRRRVIGGSGFTIDYDVLVLAPGARTLPAYDDAITFGRPGAGAAMRELLADVERGEVGRVAFVVSTSTGWALPLYELALMTAEWARNRGARSLELLLVTPEERPLAMFGEQPSAAVRRVLDTAGITFVGSTHADRRDGELLGQGRESLGVDRVVALPLIRGPELEGVPAERQFGFIPTDSSGRVTGLEGVYAAGDATDFPVKQGGLATQQADAIVHDIANRLGAPVERAPFRPRLRGMLLTGGVPRVLSGGDPGTIATQPLWLPANKIAGRWLAPYLARSTGQAPSADEPPEAEVFELS